MSGSIHLNLARVRVRLALPLAIALITAGVPGAIATGRAAAGSGAPAASAPGGPGAQSYLDTARKDCFGTARDDTSKVWFTVADGVLSDVFSPTIENSNVSTVQYAVTDGRSFTLCSSGT